MFEKKCVLICVNERHLGTLLGSLLPAPPIKDILLTHCKVFYCPFEKVKWLDFSLSLPFFPLRVSDAYVSWIPRQLFYQTKEQ